MEINSDRSVKDQQVTAVISQVVRSGRERGYEEWLKGISAAAREFEGHCGVTILKPENKVRPEYVIILRFDRYENLCKWMKSDTRREWIERAQPLVQKPQDVQILTGLENLVFLPGSDAKQPPPRYKTAFVTWIGVYSMVVLVGRILSPILASLHPLLAQAISTGLVVALLAYFVMPQLTRLFSKWLYPNQKKTK